MELVCLWWNVGAGTSQQYTGSQYCKQDTDSNTIDGRRPWLDPALLYHTGNIAGCVVQRRPSGIGITVGSQWIINVGVGVNIAN